MKTTLIAIENDADHSEAKALVMALMASKDPKDAVRLAAQARLIEAYEKSRWPRRAPTSADVLVYLMEQHDLSRADLAALLGTPSRVSEVLGGKRELSLTMIKRLRERFHIPADVLIPPAPDRRRKYAVA